MGLFHRTAHVDADLIPIAPSLPVLEDGEDVWPVPRRVGDQTFPAGSRFFTEGDCATCPRCGFANATNETQCVRCRALLPMGSSRPEFVPA